MDSSSFAFSYGAAVAQTPSPKKPVAAPAREAHGVLPVAVKTLLEAAAQNKEEFRIFGLPASKVIVCGTVECAEDLSANKLYRVKDLTGMSIIVKDYSGYCPYAPVGTMVRVVGEVRTSEEEPFLSVVQLTTVTDPTSLNYHLISATLAHCECTASVGPLDFTPVKSEMPITQTQVFVKEQALSADDLERAILQTLKAAGESGSPVDAIRRACPGNDAGVQAWLEQKLDNGDIFETGFGDSAHYATAA